MTSPLRCLLPLLVALSTALAQPGASGAGTGGCANPMLPISDSTIWIYAQTDKGGQTDTFAVRRSADDSGVVTQDSAQLPQPQVYRCVGGAVQPQQLSVSFPGLDLQVLATHGTLLGAPNQWRTGGSWSYTLDVQASMQGRLSLSGPGSLQVSYQVLGRETVNVPAGHFDSFKVRLTRVFSGKLGNLPYRATDAQTEWYAPGVGLIRSQDALDSTELLQINSQ